MNMKADDPIGTILLPATMSTIRGSYKNPVEGSIPLMGIGTPNGIQEFSEQVLGDMKQCGINIGQNILSDDSAISKSLDAASKKGMKLMIRRSYISPNLTSPLPFQVDRVSPSNSHWDSFYSGWVTTVSQYGNKSEVAGWMIADEPALKDFWVLSECKIRIQNALESKGWSKTPLFYVNLFGETYKVDENLSGGLNSIPSYIINGFNKIENYEDYYSQFNALFKPEVNSFDTYPCRLNQDGVSLNPNAPEVIYFYNTLYYYLNQKKTKGIPFWSTVLTCKVNGLNVPQPTEETIRYQAFMALVFGAQGLSFWRFCDDSSTTCAPLDQNGERSSTFTVLRNVIQDISCCASVFLGNSEVDVYVTNKPFDDSNVAHNIRFQNLKYLKFDSSTGILSTPLSFLKSVMYNGDGLVIGHHKSGDWEYIIALNMSFDKAQKVKLSFTQYVTDVTYGSFNPLSGDLNELQKEVATSKQSIIGKVDSFFGNLRPGDWRIFRK